MKNSSLHPWIIELIAALFILLFVYTGIAKLSDRHLFQTIISKSPLVGSAANLLSWILPIIELSAAVFLFIPGTKKTGLWISFGLMTLFAVYIAYMLLFSSHLPCSCGGVLKQLTWVQHLLFNIIFTLSAALGIWLYKKD